MTPSGLQVHVHRDRARIELRGVLDLDTRERFLRAVESLPPEASPVEIDLRLVGFLDSTGLSSLIEAARAVAERSGRRPRVLVTDGGPVIRMLQLTLLHLTLDVRVA